MDSESLTINEQTQYAEKLLFIRWNWSDAHRAILTVMNENLQPLYLLSDPSLTITPLNEPLND